MPFWHAVRAACNHPEKIGSHSQQCWKNNRVGRKNRVGREPEPQVFFLGLTYPLVHIHQKKKIAAQIASVNKSLGRKKCHVYNVVFVFQIY
jgi:hypothetical protein